VPPLELVPVLGLEWVLGQVLAPELVLELVQVTERVLAPEMVLALGQHNWPLSSPLAARRL
jgi:hypothetical protein